MPFVFVSCSSYNKSTQRVWLKGQKLILSKLWRREVHQQGHIPSGGSRGESVPYLFEPLRAVMWTYLWSHHSVHYILQPTSYSHLLQSVRVHTHAHTHTHTPPLNQLSLIALMDDLLFFRSQSQFS